MSSQHDPASPPVRWRKSSFSNAGNQCVEVASIAGAIAVRDSKDPDRSHLTVRTAVWQAFLDGVKRGEYDETDSF